jgi:predicted Rossmann-fold nucleotide-binding protein
MLDMLDKMVEEKTISPEDLKLLLVTDDINEAIDHISKYIKNNYVVKTRKPSWWLFEKK